MRDKVPKERKKHKHVPQRTCVGCREVHPKRSLIRIVRTQEGIFIDPSGKVSGRGTYLHNRKLCWELGLKGPIAQALKTQLTDADQERLNEFMTSLPENASTQDE